jgi:hypothetical protein
MIRKIGMMFVCLTLLGLQGCSASETGNQAGLDVETYTLEYLMPEAAARIIEPYVFGNRGGMVSIAPEIGTITVRESREMLDRIQEVLERYDQPEPSVKLSFRLIEAREKSGETDPNLEDIVSSLPTDILRFQSYRQVSKAQIMGIEFSDVSQLLAENLHVRCRIGEIRRSEDSGTVRLEVALMGDRVAFETAVNARTGQLLILGTAGPPQEDSALILALEVELVER